MYPDSKQETVAALYDQYFSVVPANTPQLRDAAHALRYQVYCVEHQFENPAEQKGERERDRYDDHAEHAVLIYKPTGDVVGCVRLILPLPSRGVSALPIRALLAPEGQATLDRVNPSKIAEISRYAVSKAFRRREGDGMYPDVEMMELAATDVRRLVPHISLGLFRGVAHIGGDCGVDTVCAAMSPALLRLLERFGLKFDPLGPPIEYHGLRQPCMADGESLLRGLHHRHADIARVVDVTYRERLKTIVR
jgi:N-acyl amino acid synthase of PEP-CTERM/exosortase system